MAKVTTSHYIITGLTLQEFQLITRVLGEKSGLEAKNISGISPEQFSKLYATLKKAGGGF
jgi:hypothetical protein